MVISPNIYLKIFHFKQINLLLILFEFKELKKAKDCSIYSSAQNKINETSNSEVICPVMQIEIQFIKRKNNRNEFVLSE